MASKGNQEHSVSLKGNPGRSNLMVLIELKLGCSQRLLRRASSLAHGRVRLPISPNTTRQLATSVTIKGNQGSSEVISSPSVTIRGNQGSSEVISSPSVTIKGTQGSSEVISSRCHSNEGGNQEATTLTCTSLSSRCRSSVANCASTCCEMAATMEVRVEASVPGRRADALLAPP